MTVLKATMLWTHDEPWCAYVKGHVDAARFAAALLNLIETDAYARENGEGWLWKRNWTDDGEELVREIVALPQHRYIRKSGRNEELGQMWTWCNVGDHGCVAVTAAIY